MENFNNKFRNLAVGVAATAASIIASPKEAVSNDLDTNTKTEVFEDKDNLEKLEKGEESIDGKEITSFKELKNILKEYGYESTPGEIPLKYIEDSFNAEISKGNRYYISMSVGQTYIAASLTAREQLKIRGHGYKIRDYTFKKDLSNKNIKILILAEYK